MPFFNYQKSYICFVETKTILKKVVIKKIRNKISLDILPLTLDKNPKTPSLSGAIRKIFSLAEV